MKVDRVLIIEDLSDVADWLMDCVQQVFSGGDLVVADCFQVAKELISTQRFDLALVDLGLPDGDGMQLIPLLKQANESVSCVVTTIYDDSDHLFAALRVGADGYLLKDHDSAEFIDQLQSIVAGRPPLSAPIAKRLLQRFRPVAKQPLGELTEREAALLTLIARGLSVKEAAAERGISYHTAAGYLKVIYQKLQVHNRAEATLEAARLGLVPPSY